MLFFIINHYQHNFLKKKILKNYMRWAKQFINTEKKFQSSVEKDTENMLMALLKIIRIKRLLEIQQLFYWKIVDKYIFIYYNNARMLRCRRQCFSCNRQSRNKPQVIFCRFTFMKVELRYMCNRVGSCFTS